MASPANDPKITLPVLIIYFLYLTNVSKREVYEAGYLIVKVSLFLKQ